MLLINHQKRSSKVIQWGRTALYGPESNNAPNTTTWLNIFCSPPSVSECGNCSAPRYKSQNDKTNATFIFIFNSRYKQILCTSIFTELRRDNTAVIFSYISARTALFQRGGIRRCFAFAWRSAWVCLRRSFGQVVQLDGWRWLLKGWKQQCHCKTNILFLDIWLSRYVFFPDTARCSSKYKYE